jgi:hypothetical protein
VVSGFVRFAQKANLITDEYGGTDLQISKMVPIEPF